MRETKEYHLGERVLRLEEALKTANNILRKNGMLGVLPQYSPPSFREANAYHARVRKILKDEQE